MESVSQSHPIMMGLVVFVPFCFGDANTIGLGMDITL